MSDYTHIEFTQIGSKINLLVNGNPAVINTKYIAGSAFSITKKNSSDVGTPFETIRYRAYKNDLVSNTATIQVDLLTQNSILSGTNKTIQISNDSEILLENHITINNSSDRIIIQDYDFSAGQLLIENQIVNPGDVIMKYNFDKLKFKSSTGTGMPYQKLYFIAANSTTQALSENYIEMNIPGIAEYNLIDYTAEIIENVIDRSLSSKITNGRINKKAKISIEINLDSAAAWPVGNNNEINFSSNNLNKRYISNITEELELSIDEFGNVEIQLEMSFVQPDFTTITGNIEIVLLSIDNDPALVSPTNNTININFTDIP